MRRRTDGAPLDLPGVCLPDFLRRIGEVDNKFSFCLGIACWENTNEKET